jgi:hypothetical protein
MGPGVNVVIHRFCNFHQLWRFFGNFFVMIVFSAQMAEFCVKHDFPAFRQIVYKVLTIGTYLVPSKIPKNFFKKKVTKFDA